MELIGVTPLPGANIWLPRPALVARMGLRPPGVDLGKWPGFRQRFEQQGQPLLVQAEIAQLPRDYFQRSQTDHTLLEVVATLAIELQRINSAEVTAYRTAALAVDSAQIVIEMEEEPLARAALETALRLTWGVATESAINFDQELRALRDLSERVCLGPSTRAIFRAAQKRGIYTRRLNHESLVLLGQGSRQHRICAAETDRTSAIAESIAGDKELTKTLLKSVGVPVPEGRPVESGIDAWEAACDIGLPVVVKPRDANHGRGVAINMTEREKIIAAFDIALKEGTGVLVERFAKGREHRLLVVGNRVVAAIRGEPDIVVGDGRATIAELIAKLNADPRRGEDYADPLSIIELDAIALSTLDSQGLNPQSVPGPGQEVLIHYNGDLTTDETDLVHPEVEAVCVAAARIIGLDVAGVDMIADDVSRSLGDQQAAIVEVNAGPGLAHHVRPLYGKPRPVGEAIVEALFPEGAEGRIPFALVLADADSAAVALLAQEILSRSGRRVARASEEGIFVGSRRILKRDQRHAGAFAHLVVNQMLDVAIAEVTIDSILQQGLGIDRCDAAVVLTADPQHPALSGFKDSPGQVLVRALQPQGSLIVLASPELKAVAEICHGSVIYVLPPGCEAFASQLRQSGGRGVALMEGKLLLIHQNQELEVGRFERVQAATNASLTPLQLLAAIATSWALGLSPESLADCLIGWSAGSAA